MFIPDRLYGLTEKEIVMQGGLRYPSVNAEVEEDLYLTEADVRYSFPNQRVICEVLDDGRYFPLYYQCTKEFNNKMMLELYNENPGVAYRSFNTYTEAIKKIFPQCR